MAELPSDGAANALLSGIVEWGLVNGVNSIIIEMEPIWLLVQLHFMVTPLGFPAHIGNGEVMAVTAGFDRRTLQRLQEMRGDTRSVLAPLVEPARVPLLQS